MYNDIIQMLNNNEFDNEPIEVVEISYFSNNDDTGELCTVYFETEEESELFYEINNGAIEVFSECPITTTRNMLLESLDRGISLVKLSFEKAGLLTA